MTTELDTTLLFHTMRLAASVDGKMSPEELTVLRSVLATLREFALADLDAMAAESDKLAKQHGGLLESALALSKLSTPALKLKAYVLAVEVAQASNSVSRIERDLLHMLRTVLELDETITKKVEEVMALKYRP